MMRTFRSSVFICFFAAASVLGYDRDLDREENSITRNQGQKWLQKLARSDFKKGDKKSIYLHFDFSPLLRTRADQFLGYIGTDYKRLNVRFTSVRKDSRESGVYHVKGTSLVGDNSCSFTGTIEVTSVHELKELPRGVDDELIDKGIRAAGTLAGKYKFSEEKKRKHSGVFQGVMTLDWYVEKDGSIRYNDLEDYGDGFRNNQYVGTWTPYGSRTAKVSNWGHSRIPYSDKLDCGAGEFGVCEEFKKRGWQ